MSAATLVSRVSAILTAMPDPMEVHYRELRLMRWDADYGDSVEDKSFFQLHADQLPETITWNNRVYRQGQTTGPRNLLVWFDCE